MILKETYITDRYRVVLRSHEGVCPFLIETEQKATENSYPWEVRADGWRACITECASTIEAATQKYERQIADERRYH